MAKMLRLFVYIHDLDNSAFPVVIDGSKTVAELKEAIFEKKHKALGEFVAHQLTLYKVTLHDDESLAEEASKSVVDANKLRWKSSGQVGVALSQRVRNLAHKSGHGGGGEVSL